MKNREDYKPQKIAGPYDASLVSQSQWDSFCSALDLAVRRALSDPARRAEYEAWKKARAAENKN